MEEKIKVSAILKTKNNEDKLCETLESIKDFDEIIILDEHSTDDTVEIAKEYNINPKKSASILDTFSCVFQAILPYGAQMLVALSAASSLGIQISALDIMSKLFYPYLLCVSSLVVIWTKKDNI